MGRTRPFTQQLPSTTDSFTLEPAERMPLTCVLAQAVVRMVLVSLRRVEVKIRAFLGVCGVLH